MTNISKSTADHFNALGRELRKDTNYLEKKLQADMARVVGTDIYTGPAPQEPEPMHEPVNQKTGD